jgi:hypothetical protein
LFFDRTDSFINGRKHLISFFNLLGLKPVPQFGTLFGCQLFDCFLDFNQIAHIKAVNSKFRLSQSWVPHISIFAGFVPTADLPKVYDIADKVLTKEDYTTWC